MQYSCFNSTLCTDYGCGMADAFWMLETSCSCRDWLHICTHSRSFWCSPQTLAFLDTSVPLFPACQLFFFPCLFYLWFQKDKSNLALLLTVLSVSSDAEAVSIYLWDTHNPKTTFSYLGRPRHISVFDSKEKMFGMLFKNFFWNAEICRGFWFKMLHSDVARSTQML